MSTYVSNRNSDGLTDENGHFRLPLKIVDGNIFEGLELSANTPPNMRINVSAGELKIPYEDYAYAAWSDATESLLVSTSSATNPRIDRVVAYVDRSMTFQSDDVNNPGCLKFMIVAGSPSGSPTPKTDGQVSTAVGGNPWIELGQIEVGRGVSQITSSNIKPTGRVPMSMSPNIKLPEITTVDGSSIKFAVISEGEPLPEAIEGSTLIVLVTKN